MLVRLCADRVQDWNLYLDPILFAYRETPHASTGFSCFELCCGRNPRGPMSILKQLWSKEKTEPEVRTLYQYVLDIRTRIEETCKLARAELAKKQDYHKSYYDKKTKPRMLKVGDNVLLLLPMASNKLELS
jgi:hypothetical protein